MRAGGASGGAAAAPPAERSDVLPQSQLPCGQLDSIVPLADHALHTHHTRGTFPVLQALPGISTALHAQPYMYSSRCHQLLHMFTRLLRLPSGQHNAPSGPRSCKAVLLPQQPPATASPRGTRVPVCLRPQQQPQKCIV